MADMVQQPPPEADTGGTRLLIAGAVGALVALTLGIYGNVHDPASDLAITLGFHNTITMKVYLATVAVLECTFMVLSYKCDTLRNQFKSKPGGATDEDTKEMAAHHRFWFLLAAGVAERCVREIGARVSKYGTVDGTRCAILVLDGRVQFRYGVFGSRLHF